MSLTQLLPFEFAQEFGIVPIADEGSAITVATAPHMTVPALSAARQRLGKPLRTQSVSAERFREIVTQTYATHSVMQDAAVGKAALRSV